MDLKNNELTTHNFKLLMKEPIIHGKEEYLPPRLEPEISSRGRIYYAILNNNKEILKNNLNKNKKGEYTVETLSKEFQQDALSFICCLGHWEICAILLAAGVDANLIFPQTGETPLLKILKSGLLTESKKKCIDILLLNGANVDVNDIYMDSPLSLVIIKDEIETLKQLISLGKANCNYTTKEIPHKSNLNDSYWKPKIGWTPFEFAVSHLRYESLKLLLLNKANVRKRSTNFTLCSQLGDSLKWNIPLFEKEKRKTLRLVLSSGFLLTNNEITLILNTACFTSATTIVDLLLNFNNNSKQCIASNICTRFQKIKRQIKSLKFTARKTLFLFLQKSKSPNNFFAVNKLPLPKQLQNYLLFNVSLIENQNFITSTIDEIEKPIINKENNEGWKTQCFSHV